MSAGFLAAAMTVARGEWRALWRQHVARVAALCMLSLTLAASLVSIERQRAVAFERAAFQSEADRQWHDQPDRHPHRVVHYGHFVFRSLEPLAFFDFGVTPFTGQSLYLEGHRQNSANFSDASQSSVLLRFGQLTPAFVLQVLAPLLIAFLAFGSVASEREAGQLRLLVAHGLRGRSLLAGKLAAHGLLALGLASPAFLALAAVGWGDASARVAAAWMAGAYTLYLLVWSSVAVLVSASLPRARDALLVLGAAWIATVILLPRLLPLAAEAQVARPTRIEAEAAMHDELARLGDSHNPDDPHFRSFREQVLARYGVSRVEDLPVNYGGLVIEEGERLTSALFERYMRADFARQEAQARVLRVAALASPVLALRELSAALAGTDRASHERFLLQAEAYRYRMVQALNRLHVNEIRYHDDRAQRIAARHWQAIPRFAHAPAPLDARLRGLAWPALAVLGAWLAALLLAAGVVAKRLERSAT